jgi:AbrB family looped-hinge helix DNA binding protein
MAEVFYRFLEYKNTIDKWEMPFYNSVMIKTVTIDQAGRVVLPKRVRDEFHLRGGDHLELESDGGRITLRPTPSSSALCRERGVWVYRSGRKTDVSIPDLTNQVRDERLNSFTS